MYIQINIGRKSGSDSLSPQTWERFISRSMTAIWDSSIDPKPLFNDIEVHQGLGNWEGMPEDSAHISLYHPSGFNLAKLKSTIEDLKRIYNQDKIAVIFGSLLI